VVLAAGIAAQNGPIPIVTGTRAELSSLHTALHATTLITDLAGPGPFTLFAPSNAAFDSLPGVLDALLANSNKALLKQLLMYHVSAVGAIPSSSIADGGQISTLEGNSLNTTNKVLVTGRSIMINTATVTTPDVGASNGVVHIIDKVLIPPGWGGTIMDVAAATPELSTWATWAASRQKGGGTWASYLSRLDRSNPVNTQHTVFAPSNAAFDALPKGVRFWLLSAYVRDIWPESVCNWRVYLAADFPATVYPMNFPESTLTVTVPANGPMVLRTSRPYSTNLLNDEASIVVPDLIANNDAVSLNGVVHIIDKVFYNYGTKTIVDLAAATPELSTLVSAVTAADLVSTLSGPGPFTLFAPSNDAFAALPAGVLNSLLDPANKVQLVELLAYHVVPGATLASEIINGTLATLQGKWISTTVTSGGVVMINDATVVQPDLVWTPHINTDILATNGIIHTIDKVLTLPVTMTVADLVVATPALSEMVTALAAGDLLSTLNGTGPFTVFAPSNAALPRSGAPKGILSALLKPENKGVLVELLSYHVANGKLMSAGLADKQQIPTLQGQSVTVTLPSGSSPPILDVMINDAGVTTLNGGASNGVVHIIDKLLIPPGWGGTIVDLVDKSSDLSTLVVAATMADLITTLSAPGPFTVFAPTNAAFDALPKGLLGTGPGGLLNTGNKDLLIQLLTYHVAAGATLAADITSNMSISTLEGGSLLATLPVGGGVMINDATVTAADTVILNNTVALNGVVHIIDKVLAPPTYAKTIVDLAVARSDLSTLVAAVTAADLISTLSGPGPFTLFAPSNAAFAALPAGVLEDLLKPENKAQLIDLLTYHVVSGATLASEISNGSRIATLQGFSVEASVQGGSVKINDATVTMPDVVAFNGTAAFNGVIHVIDKVLVVPTLPPSASPTVPPSASPASPTTPPSSGPTAPPSSGPTAPPSSGPTAPPSSGPTVPPSSGPTAPPSSGPTAPPSSGPTAPPSSGPTVPPSSGPTAPPSSGPTAPPPSGSSTGLIVGLNVGAFVLLAAVLGLCVYQRKQGQRRHAFENLENKDGGGVSSLAEMGVVYDAAGKE